ncbi:MAG TPA: hypothetical protein VGE70_09295, partial [Burkholderiaceae bacterium]
MNQLLTQDLAAGGLRCRLPKTRHPDPHGPPVAEGATDRQTATLPHPRFPPNLNKDNTMKYARALAFA